MMGNSFSQSHIRAKFPLVRTSTKENTIHNRSKVQPAKQLLAILLDGLLEELEETEEWSKDVEILLEMRRELEVNGVIREELRASLQPELMQWIESAAMRALEKNDYGTGKSFSIGSEMTNSSGTRSENHRLSVSFCHEVEVKEYTYNLDDGPPKLNKSFIQRVGKVRRSLSMRKRSSVDK